MKLMPLLVSVTLISGCTVLPGSNMSTMGKDVIKQQDADFDLDKMVNVYPLTPRLIDQLRPRPNVARPNMTLESEIANYQYRVGPGDVLNVTVWDHPELTTPAGQYRSSSDTGNWVQPDGKVKSLTIHDAALDGERFVLLSKVEEHLGEGNRIGREAVNQRAGKAIGSAGKRSLGDGTAHQGILGNTQLHTVLASFLAQGGDCFNAQSTVVGENQGSAFGSKCLHFLDHSSLPRPRTGRA